MRATAYEDRFFIGGRPVKAVTLIDYLEGNRADTEAERAAKILAQLGALDWASLPRLFAPKPTLVVLSEAEKLSRRSLWNDLYRVLRDFNQRLAVALGLERGSIAISGYQDAPGPAARDSTDPWP
jgi:hypothetical protein